MTPMDELNNIQRIRRGDTWVIILITQGKGLSTTALITHALLHLRMQRDRI